MQGGEPERASERVRYDLARLGADHPSAPDVPADVTARIGAALRAAPPPAHAATRGLPRVSRKTAVLLIVAIAAVAAALAVGIATLWRTSPAPRFPSGPTADKITVSVPASAHDTPKPVVTRP